MEEKERKKERGRRKKEVLHGVFFLHESLENARVFILCFTNRPHYHSIFGIILTLVFFKNATTTKMKNKLVSHSRCE